MYKTSVPVCPEDSGGVVYDSMNWIVGTVVGSAHTTSNKDEQTVNTCKYSIIGRADLAVDAFSEWRCSIA